MLSPCSSGHLDHLWHDSSNTSICNSSLHAFQNKSRPFMVYFCSGCRCRCMQQITETIHHRRVMTHAERETAALAETAVMNARAGALRRTEGPPGFAPATGGFVAQLCLLGLLIEQLLHQLRGQSSGYLQLRGASGNKSPSTDKEEARKRSPLAGTTQSRLHCRRAHAGRPRA